MALVSTLLIVYRLGGYVLGPAKTHNLDLS